VTGEKVAKTSNRGSAPGERRGGRKAGVPNKATASLKEIARQYTDDALETLATIMGNEGEPAAARVSAANALLDRGYGKPSQLLGGDTDNPLTLVTRIELVDGDGKD
jgi:hypothetical protein